MCLYTRKVIHRKTSFLDESLKNSCSKAEYKTSRIKTIVSQIWLKAIKNYFANKPNQGLPNAGKSAEYLCKQLLATGSLKLITGLRYWCKSAA